MKLYELVLNVSPQLEEKGRENLIAEIEKILKKIGGEIKDKATFQKISLAYPLKKEGQFFDTSFLLSLTVVFLGQKIKKLEDELKHHPEILRYLLVKKKVLKEPKKTSLDKPQKKLREEKPKIETKQPLLEKKVKKETSRPKKKKLKLEDIDKSLEKLLEQEL